MEREQAVRLTQNLLRKMVEKDGSDLFLTTGFPPAIKVDGQIHKATDTPLTAAQSSMMVRSIMNDKQIKEFDATKECNFAISPQGIGRFRVLCRFPSSHAASRARHCRLKQTGRKRRRKQRRSGGGRRKEALKF